MREILFKGKTLDGAWICGYLHKIDGIGKGYKAYGIQAQDINTSMCRPHSHEVIPETVGQFTGLTDKKGKKVFEGDIVNVNTKPNSLEHGYKSKHLVVRFDEYHRFVASGRLEYPLCNHYEWEVIGNIHDNPELLEEKEK